MEENETNDNNLKKKNETIEIKIDKSIKEIIDYWINNDYFESESKSKSKYKINSTYLKQEIGINKKMKFYGKSILSILASQQIYPIIKYLNNCNQNKSITNQNNSKSITNQYIPVKGISFSKKTYYNPYEKYASYTALEASIYSYLENYDTIENTKFNTSTVVPVQKVNILPNYRDAFKKTVINLILCAKEEKSAFKDEYKRLFNGSNLSLIVQSDKYKFGTFKSKNTTPFHIILVNAAKSGEKYTPFKEILKVICDNLNLLTININEVDDWGFSGFYILTWYLLNNKNNTNEISFNKEEIIIKFLKLGGNPFINNFIENFKQKINNEKVYNNLIKIYPKNVYNLLIKNNSIIDEYKKIANTFTIKKIGEVFVLNQTYQNKLENQIKQIQELKKLLSEKKTIIYNFINNLPIKYVERNKIRNNLNLLYHTETELNTQIKNLLEKEKLENKKITELNKKITEYQEILLNKNDKIAKLESDLRKLAFEQNISNNKKIELEELIKKLKEGFENSNIKIQEYDDLLQELIDKIKRDLLDKDIEKQLRNDINKIFTRQFSDKNKKNFKSILGNNQSSLIKNYNNKNYDALKKKIDTLITENSSLIKDSKTSKNKKKRYIDQNTNLKKLKNLIIKLEENLFLNSGNKKSNIKKLINKTIESLQQKNQKIKNIERLNEEQKNDLNQKAKNIEELQKKIANQQSKINEKIGKLNISENAKKELDELNQKIQELQKKITEKNEENLSIQIELNELKEKGNQNNKKIAELERVNTELEQAKAEFEIRLSEISVENEENKQEINKLKELCNKQEALIKQRENEIQEFKDLLNLIRNKLKTIGINNSSKTENELMNDVIKLLKNKNKNIEELKSQSKTQIAELQGLTENQRTKIQEKENRLNELQSQYETQRSEIGRRIGELGIQIPEIKTLEKTITQLETIKSEKETLKRQLESNSTASSEEIKRIESELEKIKTDKNLSNTQISRLSGVIKYKQGKQKEIEETIKSLHKSIQKEQTEEKRLQDELQTLRSNNPSKDNAIKNLKGEINELNETSEREKEEHDKLVKQIEDITKQQNLNKKTKGELVELLKSINSNKSNKEKLEQERNSTKQQYEKVLKLIYDFNEILKMKQSLQKENLDKFIKSNEYNSIPEDLKNFFEQEIKVLKLMIEYYDIVKYVKFYLENIKRLSLQDLYGKEEYILQIKLLNDLLKVNKKFDKENKEIKEILNIEDEIEEKIVKFNFNKIENFSDASKLILIKETIKNINFDINDKLITFINNELSKYPDNKKQLTDFLKQIYNNQILESEIGKINTEFNKLFTKLNNSQNKYIDIVNFFKTYNLFDIEKVYNLKEFIFIINNLQIKKNEKYNKYIISNYLKIIDLFYKFDIEKPILIYKNKNKEKEKKNMILNIITIQDLINRYPNKICYIPITSEGTSQGGGKKKQKPKKKIIKKKVNKTKINKKINKKNNKK
jgi:chromosome segregation ATPase